MHDMRTRPESPARRLFCLAVIAAIVTVFVAAFVTACDSPEPGDPESIARRLVAEFLSVPVIDTTLVSVTPREFNDSSLDCPQPGVSYMQVITPGYRVVVEADGRRFDVRVSGSHGKICRRKKGGSRAGKPPSPAAEIIDRARADLAEAIDAGVSEISVLGVQAYRGQAIAEGCAPECDIDSEKCGYMIGLLHDDRRFNYYANGDLVTACPPILAR
jgi:hypothetical protein